MTSALGAATRRRADPAAAAWCGAAQAQKLAGDVAQRVLVSAVAAEEALTRPGLAKHAVRANVSVRRAQAQDSRTACRALR